MWVCVCVYATHTHTAQMGYLDVSPGVVMRHLEGPKNSDGLNLGIYVCIYVYKPAKMAETQPRSSWGVASVARSLGGP